MSEQHRTSTETLISALRILAAEIQSDDGVATMAIAEGADRIASLRADLARVTAEREEAKRNAAQLRSAYAAAEIARNEQERESATLRARVGELESTISTAAKGNQSLAERLEQCEYFREQDKEGWMVLKARSETAEQRNAELVAALRGAAGGLRNCMDMLDELDGLNWGEDGMPFTIDWDYLKPLLARAESATETVKESLTVKQSPDIDAESLIAACIPGGSICDPQQVADAIREYLRPQEPCGGRCGDPECDLDTNGVTMRTPAPHADTVRDVLEQFRIETIRHAANAIFNKLSEVYSCGTHTEQGRQALFKAQRLADAIVASPNASAAINGGTP